MQYKQQLSPQEEARARGDFRVFLFLIWKFLGLPDPTPVQYDIAYYLQYGPRRSAVLAFRGLGKSWITSAFVLWLLWNDLELKVLVVSASKDRADAFSIFSKRLLDEVPWLRHLRPDPRKGDRDSNIAFDIRGCRPAHAPSVKSVGITGQITGSRADVVICDDVEVPNNSETATQREKLRTRVSELGGAVLTPEAKAGKVGGVKFLGTHQTEDSLYNFLPERGYELRIWPAKYPDDVAVYNQSLAPFLWQQLEAGDAMPGQPTDPKRFDEFELNEREIEYGPAGFQLQYMLDTRQTDEDRHPLKLKDFIVFQTDATVAPDWLVWGSGEDQSIAYLPNVGLQGDGWFRPMKVCETFSPFEQTIMYVDPSGRGTDQTGYCVVRFLHGFIFVVEWGGLDGGYDEKNLTKLATIASEQRVQVCVVEDNFGDGMWAQLFRPILARVYRTARGEGCSVEEDHATGQKERRILASLGPAMANHKLVIDEALVKRMCRRKDGSLDADAALKNGPYQLSRLTRDRGSLKFDDWMDALAGAVRFLTTAMGRDAAQEESERKAERLDKELRKFVDGAHGGGATPRTFTDRL